ncbi:ParA family protein [Rouxiella badensis]|uniref:ParA family protein n=1 Tax=Rouxiella badensis TaxID=1646377 RepID=UPI001D157325|nr:ParA family protein [Rouxiella badensis]MCC3705160.1 ParA family protein [Rouxiella badensis]
MKNATVLAPYAPATPIFNELHFPVIVPVISTKGGEGKSTQAGNLASFAADAGLKTLLIDGDHSQPTASSMFALEYEAPCGLYELLTLSVNLDEPDSILSHTCIPGLDLIVSNDPRDRLTVAMLQAPDGRMRLRDRLKHPLFSRYDLIIIDSKGSASVMLELILLAATEFALGVIKPILPDTREFLRGTVGVMACLLPLEAYGIRLPAVRILINCMDNTTLDRQTLASLTDILNFRQYPHADSLNLSLLDTKIPLLEIYKAGHACGQPAHRLEHATARKISLSAADTMHALACELFPHWTTAFNHLLATRKAGKK